MLESPPQIRIHKLNKKKRKPIILCTPEYNSKKELIQISWDQEEPDGQQDKILSEKLEARRKFADRQGGIDKYTLAQAVGFHSMQFYRQGDRRKNRINANFSPSKKKQLHHSCTEVKTSLKWPKVKESQILNGEQWSSNKLFLNKSRPKGKKSLFSKLYNDYIQNDSHPRLQRSPESPMNFAEQQKSMRAFFKDSKSLHKQKMQKILKKQNFSRFSQFGQLPRFSNPPRRFLSN